MNRGLGFESSCVVLLLKEEGSTGSDEQAPRGGPLQACQCPRLINKSNQCFKRVLHVQLEEGLGLARGRAKKGVCK